MWSLVVVIGEVLGQKAAQLIPIGGAMAIDALLLHASPKSFDERIVRSPALAIHAHLDAFLDQRPGKEVAGVLAALVGIEDHWCRILQQRTMQSFQTEGGVQGVADLPREHVAAVPVHHGGEIQEPFAHGDVGDVGAPNMPRSFNLHTSQQVGIDPMPVGGFAQVRLGRNGLQAH